MVESEFPQIPRGVHDCPIGIPQVPTHVPQYVSNCSVGLKNNDAPEVEPKVNQLRSEDGLSALSPTHQVLPAGDVISNVTVPALQGSPLGPRFEVPQRLGPPPPQ